MRGHIARKGNRYYAVYRFEGKYHWILGGTIKKEAQAVLNKKLAEIADGEHVILKDIVFDAFAARWLEEKKGDVKESTIDFYRPIVKHNLIPFFRGSKLKKIDYRLCKKYVDRKQQEGKLNNRTIGYHCMVLSMIFKEAVREGYLKGNPAQYIKRPKAVKKESKVLTPEELQRFLGQVNPRYKALFLLAAHNGLRQGEILAASWDDLNFEEGTLTVRRSYRKGRFTEPKTEGSKRVVTLDAEVLNELRRYKRKYKLQAKNHPLNLIFVTEEGAPLDAITLYKKEFLPALERANVPKIRFHDLRHGYCTYRSYLRHPISDIAYDAGHVNKTTTLGYTHRALGLQREQVGELAAFLKSGKTTTKNLN